MPSYPQPSEWVPRALRAGLVIPAHPLALTAEGTLDERSQRALTRYYRAAGAGGLAVGEIGARLNIPPATLNHHLAQLKQAGLVKCVREGRKLVHSADYGRMDSLLSYLTYNCCQGGARAPAQAN